MTPLEIAEFCAVVAVSAVTQAVTGFGFTLLALGILGCWMDLRDATVLLAPVGLTMNVLLFLRLRSHFVWSGLTPLFVTALAFVPVGAYLLLQLERSVLELILAGVMLATAAQGLWGRSGGLRPWHPVRAGIPCGLAGGLLSGAFGTGGPPVVIFLLHRPVNRFQFVASVQSIFGATAALRVIHFLVAGELKRGHLTALVPGACAAALGVLGGVRLLHHLSETWARRIVLWFVVVCGLRYLIAACLH